MRSRQRALLHAIGRARSKARSVSTLLLNLLAFHGVPLHPVDPLAHRALQFRLGRGPLSPLWRCPAAYLALPAAVAAALACSANIELDTVAAAPLAARGARVLKPDRRPAESALGSTVPGHALLFLPFQLHDHLGKCGEVDWSLATCVSSGDLRTLHPFAARP